MADNRYGSYIFFGGVVGFFGGIVGSYTLGACEAYARGASLAGCAATGAAFALLLVHPATWIGAALGGAIGGIVFLARRRAGRKAPTRPGTP